MYWYTLTAKVIQTKSGVGKLWRQREIGACLRLGEGLTTQGEDSALGPHLNAGLRASESTEPYTWNGCILLPVNYISIYLGLEIDIKPHVGRHKPENYYTQLSGAFWLFNPGWNQPPDCQPAQGLTRNGIRQRFVASGASAATESHLEKAVLYHRLYGVYSVVGNMRKWAPTLHHTYLALWCRIRQLSLQNSSSCYAEIL